MASALSLTLIGTRGAKIQTKTIFQTVESRSQVSDVLDALLITDDLRTSILNEEGGFEIETTDVTNADTVTELFVNGVEVQESVYLDLIDAKDEIRKFQKVFEDVRLVAEVA